MHSGKNVAISKLGIEAEDACLGELQFESEV